ncbi:MAG: hypothetical protein IJW28_05975, partial [Clostridia bacterium]|nr:hypothetical protein [Clostridia bacterium]
YGGSMAFNITANTDYIIASVKVDGVEQNNKNTYVFSNVTSDHTIDIVFAKSTYSVLTYVISGVDSGYVTNPSTVSYGEDLVIMLYPSSHYVISALTINGKNIDDLSDITDRIVIENVDDDYILEITFAFTHYNITIEEVEGGSVVGDTTANPAESKRYIIEAQAGYTFSKLYVNDVEVVVSQDGDEYYYMLIDINSDYVIRAEFTKNTFTITFEMNNTAWGGILPAPANNIAVVEYGSDYTTIIRPREGYIVSKVLVDGVEYNATNNVVVLTDIVDNHTVSITFVINKKHTISTYQYTDNGSIIVNSEALVGQKVVFSVIPTEGYKVKSINLYDANGNDIAYDKNTYTFTMSNSTVNIRVEYEKIVVEDPGDEPGDDPVNPNPPVTPPTDPTPPPVAPPAESSVDVVMIVVIIIVAVLAVGAVVTIVVIVVIKKKNQPYFHSK